jgi:fumarate reductase subunit D
MSNIDLGGVKGNLDAYLYFGVGLLLFSLISIFVTLKKRREFIPFFKSRFGKTILLIAVLLWCYSVTYRISFGSHEIGLDAPKILRWALSMFRSSGRFMWILSYALFILGLFVLLRFLNQKKVTAILLICLSVQTLDMAPILWKRHTSISNAVIPDAIPLDPVSVRKFSEVSFGKKEFLIFPPTSMKGWPTLPYLAWKNGLSSGFFQSSRVNYTAAKRVQSRLRQIVCEERLPDTWLVAIPSDELQLFEGCNLDTYRLDEFEGHTFIFR